MMGSVLLSRIMGMVREMVLARLLGTHVEMDAYVASFIIPEFLNHFLAGGFLSITFIPIFHKYMMAGERDKAWRSFSNLLTIGSIAFVVLIGIAMIFTDQVVGLLGSHISGGPMRELTVRLTRIIMPAQLLFYWGAFFMAVQYAQHRFFLPALAPLFYNAGIIVCGWALYRRLGVAGFAWGVVAGAFVGNVAIQLPGALRTGMRFHFRFAVKDRDLATYVLLTLPLVVGLGMSFSNEIFFRFFGSFLGTGALSSVNYALRTMNILVGVFGQASGVASYPFLSRLAVEKKIGEMNRLLNGIVVKIGVYCIPVSLVMMALSTQIIAVLFQHGKFTAESTASTAPILVMYLIGAFPYAASTIVMRNFYATQNTVFPMIVSTAVALSSVPCYIVFSRAMGGRGIALAASIMMMVQVVVLYWAWSSRRDNRQGFFKVAAAIGKITGISVLGAGCAYGIKLLLANHGLPGVSFLQNATILVLSGVPALILAFALLEAARLGNTRELAVRIFGRVKK
jgi:putative peptidoglycan lipid II flippase